MNTAVGIAERIFVALLGAYPAAFRESFDSEMREMFSESVCRAADRGILPFLAVVLRELGDLPVNVLAEH
ncbi:MAG: hypothetical protein JW929_14600 [Anaerolineales bacterium]|nr:hypothetical protein [Anaerolineales bacterium]